MRVKLRTLLLRLMATSCVGLCCLMIVNFSFMHKTDYHDNLMVRSNDNYTVSSLRNDVNLLSTNRTDASSFARQNREDFYTRNSSYLSNASDTKSICEESKETIWDLEGLISKGLVVPRWNSVVETPYNGSFRGLYS